MVSRIYENKLSHKKIFYKIGFVDAKDVAMDKEKYSRKCKDGCGVYGECWACPPYLPSFSDIKANLRRMLVLVSYKYNKRASKRPYDTVFNSYNAMAPKMHKIGMVLEKKLDGFLLKSGPCRVCRKCAALRKKPCKFPEKKRYALESVGVNVEKLAIMLNHNLLWCDGKSLPAYTTVVCGVLTSKKISRKQLFREFSTLMV